MTTSRLQAERAARARLTYELNHPEDPAVILGTLNYWTSYAAQAVYTEAERLAAIDAVLAQHRTAKVLREDERHDDS